MEALGMTDRKFQDADRFYDDVVCWRLADERFGATGEEAEWEEEQEPEEDDAE